jgi:hypothetical protein
VTADILRSDLPFWTQDEFDRLDREAKLRRELVGYDPDVELIDGRTPRAHLEELVGAEVTAQLIGV